MTDHLSMSDAYDAFLFESLGTEPNGMDLSVLSALARAGLDPWAEAKRLAALPRQAAIAAIIAVLHLTTEPETARRLAELLPRSTAAQPQSAKSFDRQAMFRKYGLVAIVIWLIMAVAVMMYASPPSTSRPAEATPIH